MISMLFCNGTSDNQILQAKSGVYIIVNLCKYRVNYFQCWIVFFVHCVSVVDQLALEWILVFAFS